MVVRINTPKGERLAVVLHELETVETILTFQSALARALQTCNTEYNDGEHLFDIGAMLEYLQFKNAHLTDECKGLEIPHLEHLPETSTY